MELHDAELRIINMIYCHVVQLEEVLIFLTHPEAAALR